MDIFYAVLILLGLGSILGAVLTVASVFLSVKGNEKALAGYDELNVMQDNSTESTGNVDSDSNAPMYKTIATPFSDFANELKKAFKQGDYGEIAKIIVEKLNSALSKIQP